MRSTAPVTAAANPLIRKICRLGRFLIFLATAGWAFPHVCTEDMDLTRIQKEHMAKQS